jgi:cytochrome b561
MNDGKTAWPLPLRLLHWASAALITAALGVGVFMVNIVHDPARRFDLTQTHKSIGVAVLALTAARLCLRCLTAAPPPPLAPPLCRAAKAAKEATHAGLYALLLLLPLSGWLMATSSPVRVPTSVFGLFALPYPLEPDLATWRVAWAMHAACAVALAALAGLHIAAALVHALWRRDGVLTRM